RGGRNRGALKPRETVISLVLFALAFFGALVAQKPRSPVARAASAAGVQRTAPAPPPRTRSAVAPVGMLTSGEYAVVPAVAPTSGAPADSSTAEQDAASVELAVDTPSEVTSVRESLRLASADEDEDVAARAQEEYEALVERDER